MKRTSLFILSGILLAVLMFGGMAFAQDDVPPRPVIQIVDADDNAYDGLPGAFCWLQAVNDIRCEPDPLEMEPEEFIEVKVGDAITFTVESESGPPSAFSATLLDDEDADGDPILLDFGAVDSAEYEVDLDLGEHRVSVLAEYDVVAGDNSFVTFIFGLDVGEGDEDTATAAVSSTQRPTATTAGPTPTKADDDEDATSEVEETPTEEADAPTAQPTAVLPTEAPTSPPPTIALPATAVPTIALATLIPIPTQVSAAGDAALGVAPEVVLVNGGDRFLPTGVEYCYDDNGREVCVSQPSSPETRRVLVSSGATIRIDAAEGGPLTMNVALLDNNLAQEFERVDNMIGSAVSLHVISGAPGNYVLVVEAVWPESAATYFFRVRIVD